MTWSGDNKVPCGLGSRQGRIEFSITWSVPSFILTLPICSCLRAGEALNIETIEAGVTVRGLRTEK